jgi:hypothetical protein
MACARASYCEIYNEQVYDLLKFTKQPLPVKWDARKGFHVAGLCQRDAKSLPEMLQVSICAALVSGYCCHIAASLRIDSLPWCCFWVAFGHKFRDVFTR